MEASGKCDLFLLTVKPVWGTQGGVLDYFIILDQRYSNLSDIPQIYHSHDC